MSRLPAREPARRPPLLLPHQPVRLPETLPCHRRPARELARQAVVMPDVRRLVTPVIERRVHLGIGPVAPRRAAVLAHQNPMSTAAPCGTGSGATPNAAASAITGSTCALGLRVGNCRRITGSRSAISAASS